ncbi:MAG TPA: hypothetical protein VD973_19250, partial [Symbiobacteriaceae bacterium]|nr:hypothetical protein [Symbiobacteriaceae bacterium]
RAGKPIYTLVRNKYYFDEIYDVVFVQGTHLVSRAVNWFDANIVDGLVNGVGVLGNWTAWLAGKGDEYIVDPLVTMWAFICRQLSSGFRRLSTGYVQQHMLTFVVVIVASVLLFQVYR